jgi:signal transduction histidine kinase
MFVKARLKLTGWYLLIIMIISLAFSGVIYRASSFELRRFAEAQQNRFERRIVPYPPIIDDELFIEAQHRIANSLILINITILGVSAILGYYLSGKTLSPIKEMVDEQYRFVSDASHELKTPITAIKTTLEVALRDKKLGLAESKKTLKTSLEEVDRLQKLAEGLLELTNKKLMLELLPLNLAGIVETTVKMVKPLSDKKKIDISVKIPKIIIMTEESSMTRALITILDNAIKYGPDNSKVEVSAKVVGKSVRLSIIDKGKGIHKKDIPHVFDRFYRSDLARSENGYGLGLSIAKQIVEEHSGNIEIESVQGKGTTVTIILPYSARLQKTRT